MGLFERGTMTKQNPVTMLTPGFQARGVLQSMGMMQTFLNDEQKPILALRDTTLYGLERGNPASSIAVGELYLRKDACHALAFEDMLSHEETGLLPRAEPLVLYTSHYAIQGQVHMGPEDRLIDFIAVSKLLFVGLTDAAVFPLFEPQTAVIQQAPLIFVHRDRVLMHHPV